MAQNRPTPECKSARTDIGFTMVPSVGHTVQASFSGEGNLLIKQAPNDTILIPRDSIEAFKRGVARIQLSVTI